MTRKFHADQVGLSICGEDIKPIEMDRLPHEIGMPDQDLTLLSPGDMVWVRDHDDGIWRESRVRFVCDGRYVYAEGYNRPFSQWEIKKP